MNILILGAHFANKGAEALLLTTQQELGRRLADSVFFFPNYPLHTKRQEARMAQLAGFRLLAPATLVGQLGSLGIGMLTRWPIARAAWSSPVAAYLLKHIGQIDAVVDASGFAFGDTWGLAPVKRIAPVVEYCAALGKPVVFLPQAWGPFDSPALAASVQAMCKNASLLYARDEQSNDFLSKAVGPQGPEIKLAPDIAFRFRSGDAAEGAALLAGLGIKVGQRPIVGLAPNMRAYERSTGSGSENAYLSAVIGLVRHCTSELDAHVLLIPHEVRFGTTSLRDDRYLCRIIADSFSEEPSVSVLTESHPAAMVKAIIANLDLLIGSRFHTIVGALSDGVPAVVLGWSHKYIELMRLFDLDQYVVDHTAHNEVDLCQLVDLAWKDREENRQRIRFRLPALEQQVDQVFDEVAEVLRQGQV